LTGRNYKTVLIDNIPIVNSEATISIEASTLGVQSFKFYCPDAQLSILREISVCPFNATLADEASGDDAVLTVQMPNDASGNLTLYIYAWDDDSEKLLAFTSAYEGSIAIIKASDIPAGRWIESYYLIDDAKYGKSSFREGNDFIVKEVEEEIIPVSTNLTVSASDITASEVAIIDITIASNATGKVTVDGKEVTMANGAGKYEISGLAGGVYNYTVKFAGDKYFNADEKTVTIKVAKLASSVSIDVGSAYNVGDSFTIAITNSTAAVVFINNKTYEVKDGKVVINTTALSAGTYEVVATIAEDDMFSASSDNATFTINLIGTEIVVVNETLDLYTLDYVEDVASLNPADAGDLIFVSSDDNVVSIMYGAIIANGTGTATVTVSFAGNDKYAVAESKTITVNVRLKDASVSVENDTLDLNVDDRYSINATTIPNWMSVEYASSDESVATVTDYGLVTAVGEGTAIITVTVGNGETYAVNSTNVTVKVSKLPSEIITEKDSINMKVNEEFGAPASLIPSAAGNLTYVISDESVINIVNGIIVAVGAGNANVTYSFAGNDKYTAAESKTIQVTVTAKDLPKTITKDTINSYFDKNGVYIADLDEITFVGEFAAIGALTFNKSVKITGQDAVFNNVSFKINAADVSVEGITFNNAATDYVITATDSNRLSLVGNNFNAVNGILLSDCENFTLDSNAITSTSGVNVNGIYITGTASGIVKNNNLNLKSEKAAYAINTNPTGPFKVSYINNTIYAESYFAVGIYDDSELIKDNNITLVCNYGAGIVVLSDDTTVVNNEVTVNASNEGSEEIPDENVNETSGIVVKANAEITNNTVESTAKSISVVEGSSTISDNQLLGSVSVSSDGNNISGNTIVTDEEYAIDLGNSSGNTVSDNELQAGESQGSDAINSGSSDNVISGNDIVNSTFDVTGPVEFDYGASGSTEVVNLTGASAVTAFVVDHTEASVTVEGSKVTVSGLNPGSYTLNITTVPDKGFAASSKLVGVTVNKVKAPISNDTFNFDENKTVESKTPTYSISLPSDATGNLTVTIGDKTYTKALVNGSATVVVDDLPAGDYNVTVAYSGDSKYSAIVKTSKATVKVDPKVVMKQTTALYTGTYSVTVYGEDGKVAENANVVFYINGKKVKAVKANAKGVATFNLLSNYLPNKKYNIKATALGKSVTKKVTVKHVVTLKAVTVKKSAKKLVLQATLSKVNGKYLKNKKITFKFNGKKYTAKTNKKGVAKVTIKSKVLKKLKVGKKVTYQATYLKDTVKKTVKIQK
jgi:parallel beta-helix repeat protein